MWPLQRYSASVAKKAKFQPPTGNLTWVIKPAGSHFTDKLHQFTVCGRKGNGKKKKGVSQVRTLDTSNTNCFHREHLNTVIHKTGQKCLRNAI
jgi:hypothetical protein